MSSTDVKVDMITINAGKDIANDVLHPQRYVLDCLGLFSISQYKIERILTLCIRGHDNMTYVWGKGVIFIPHFIIKI